MRLSASQVQTFVNCPRAWSWRYIEGVADTPSPAAEKGRAVHAALEKYLAGGTIDFTDEIGYIAAAGVEHLPKPGTPGLLIEQEFHFEGPSGHTYLGYKDLEEPGIIYDHKTTSDLRWQKTEEELASDLQATLYAVDYFRKNPEDPAVELRWVYYQTKNTRKSAVTRTRVTQTETWQRFLAIEKTAEDMEVASTLRALELPPNIKHCDAYGGCPHQGRCNLSPFDKMRSYMEQNKLVQLLKNKNQNANGAAPPVAATAPAVPAVPAAFAPGGAFHGTAAAASYVAPPAPAPGPAPPAQPAQPTQNKLLAHLQARGAPTAAAPAAINPPEFQPPPAPVVAPPPAVLPLPAPAAASTLPATAQAAGQELAESLSIPSATVAEKRGRGRPKSAAVPATNVGVKIKTLYINCGPVGVPVVDANHLIVLAKKTLADGGLADYRFAEYGQGPGLLAIAVAAEIDAIEGVLPALRLDTTTPEGSILVVELQARAETVVR